MKKNLIIIGMIFILIFVGLSGCYEPDNDNNNNGELPDIHDREPINHIKIGDSVIVDDINYTFERVYTAVRFIDDFKIFTIEINGTNIGNLDRSGSVTAYIYKMEDGTKYDAPLSTNSTAGFTLGPWENKKSYIYCSRHQFAIYGNEIWSVGNEL